MIKLCFKGKNLCIPFLCLFIAVTHLCLIFYLEHDCQTTFLLTRTITYDETLLVAMFGEGQSTFILFEL